VSLWYPGTERHMYDPSGNSEHESRGDWSFLCKDIGWRAVQTGEAKVDYGPVKVKPEGEDELSEEEGEQGEQNDHKKETVREQSCERGPMGQGRTEELKCTEKREGRKSKVLGTTALASNKAQF